MMSVVCSYFPNRSEGKTNFEWGFLAVDDYQFPNNPSFPQSVVLLKRSRRVDCVNCDSVSPFRKISSLGLFSQEISMPRSKQVLVHHSFSHVLFLNSKTSLVYIELQLAIAEIAFPLCFLIKGVNTEYWQKRNQEVTLTYSPT
jgi:hypothetical protein